MSEAQLPFKAELTPEQVEEGEQIDSANGWVRRVGLMMLTQSQTDLSSMAKDDEAAEAMVELAEALARYIERQSNELDLLKSARARLLLVLGDELDRLEANA